MRYRTLASDYDGTLAVDGVLQPAARRALHGLRAADRRRLLVTGRRLDDLSRACPELSLFDAVVAENGALLHLPATGATRVLEAPPPRAFVEALAASGVDPLYAGRVILATAAHHEGVVRETLRAMGLGRSLALSFNKGAVMVLPSGIDKGAGLRAALAELGLSAAETVGVGDGENDAPLLDGCGYAVAVADAVPGLKARADLVTVGPGGVGVAELAAAMTADDLPVSRRRRALSPDGATS